MNEFSNGKSATWSIARRTNNSISPLRRLLVPRSSVRELGEEDRRKVERAVVAYRESAISVTSDHPIVLADPTSNPRARKGAGYVNISLDVGEHFPGGPRAPP